MSNEAGAAGSESESSPSVVRAIMVDLTMPSCRRSLHERSEFSEAGEKGSKWSKGERGRRSARLSFQSSNFTCMTSCFIHRSSLTTHHSYSLLDD